MKRKRRLKKNLKYTILPRTNSLIESIPDLELKLKKSQVLVKSTLKAASQQRLATGWGPTHFKAALIQNHPELVLNVNLSNRGKSLRTICKI